MGTTQHHAIVVTGQADDVQALHAAAMLLAGDLVSPIVPARANGYASFFVAPDGSYEGRRVSDDGDAAREKFRALLHERRADWAEVSYGELGDAAEGTRAAFDPPR